MTDIAQLLDDAARHGKLLDGLPQALTLDEAYAVQRAQLLLRVERGERQIGWKMGMTSRAKMQQMNLDAPIYGFLTHPMLLADGATLPQGACQQPRVEPEICFIMKRDIFGPVSPAQALAAVEGVCPALEVIDSRFKDFKFNLPSVVADNTSAAYVVLGTVLSPASDIGSLGIVLESDGNVVDTASSAAIYDHPARSLAQLINMLSPRGLSAGDIVMSGGATQAISLVGLKTVRVSIERLGTATLRIASGGGA